MSYSPGDEYMDGVISSCCGARVTYGEFCADCKDHCSTEPEVSEEENKHRKFSPEQEATIEKLKEAEDIIQPLIIGESEYIAWHRTVSKINELVEAVNALLKAASASSTPIEE